MSTKASKQRRFLCLFCHQRILVVEKEVHLRVVHGIEPVRPSCNQCDFQAKSEHGLKIHRQRKHQVVVEFSCAYCTHKPFKSARRLATHQAQKHSPVEAPVNRIEQCTRCGEFFSYRGIAAHRRCCPWPELTPLDLAKAAEAQAILADGAELEPTPPAPLPRGPLDPSLFAWSLKPTRRERAIAQRNQGQLIDANQSYLQDTEIVGLPRA